LTKFDDDFQLVVRSEQDIKLEGTRAIPFYRKFSIGYHEGKPEFTGLGEFYSDENFLGDQMLLLGMAMQNLLVEQE
jgi:hypothetical protein